MIDASEMSSIQTRSSYPASSSPSNASSWIDFGLPHAWNLDSLRARMMQRLVIIARRLTNLLGRPQPTVNRSQLMGMYLSQANRTSVIGGRGAENRQRQDGKFAQNRRRGG